MLSSQVGYHPPVAGLALFPAQQWERSLIYLLERYSIFGEKAPQSVQIFLFVDLDKKKIGSIHPGPRSIYDVQFSAFDIDLDQGVSTVTLGQECIERGHPAADFTSHQQRHDIDARIYPLLSINTAAQDFDLPLVGLEASDPTVHSEPLECRRTTEGEVAVIGADIEHAGHPAKCRLDPGVQLALVKAAYLSQRVARVHHDARAAERTAPDAHRHGMVGKQRLEKRNHDSISADPRSVRSRRLVACGGRQQLLDVIEPAGPGFLELAVKQIHRNGYRRALAPFAQAAGKAG